MATTIIDFSPQALEIDQVASAAGVINPNVPPPVLPTVNSTSVNLNSNLNFGSTFIGNAPDILFVAEYAPPGQEAIGVLVAWENYYNATHYELWKRIYNAQDNSWQRIFVCDANHLKTETAQWSSYIQNYLKIDVPFTYYAIMDTNVQKDQIVQYKVGAGNYPTNASVNFELVLKSKNALTPIAINTTDTIFDVSTKVFGVPYFAWVIALCNTNAQFFGKFPATNSLYSFVQTRTIQVPKDMAVIPKGVSESIYYFGLYSTLQNLFNYTRDYDEIGDFFNLALQSINAAKGTLSYNTLQSKIKTEYPSYADYTTRLAKGTISNQPIVIPNYTDATSFNSLSDLTYMFLRLNTILIATNYAQDNDARIKLAASLSETASHILGGLESNISPAKPFSIIPVAFQVPVESSILHASALNVLKKVGA